MFGRMCMHVSSRNKYWERTILYESDPWSENLILDGQIAEW